MKPESPQSFTIPIGNFSLRIPPGALVPDSTFWNTAIEADRLAREGYTDIARREVERLQAFFRAPEPKPAQPKVELPDHERGRSAYDLKELDKLNARLAKPPTRRGRQSAMEAREADLAARDHIERLPDIKAEERWLSETAKETASLAHARGEDVQRPKSGAVRVVSRDPLLALLRLGKLTADQYDIGIILRDAYESRSEGVGSQLGAVNSIGGAHNNDRYVFNGLQRAKALQRIGRTERAILLSTTFVQNGSQSHVGLTMVRAVCGEGKSLSSQGEGRAFERNLLALKLALDVAAEVGR